MEDVIKVEKKEKEDVGMKKKIKEERNREVENKVREKKQVVKKKIVKTVRIVVAHMNTIEGRSKADLA